MRNSQIISELVVTKLLRTIALLMRNFIANFVRILGICNDFAGNRVNELGNVPRCGVVPKFSDLEVIALGITAEAFGFDSENRLFHRLHSECKDDLPNLISRRQPCGATMLPLLRIGEIVPRRGGTITDINSMQSAVYVVSINDVRWEYHDCMMLGEKGYFSAEVQKNLFEVANITLEVPYRLNQKKLAPSILNVQEVPKTYRNYILPTQRQSHDDSELCKAILQSLYPHGRQNRSNDLHAICQFR